MEESYDRREQTGAIPRGVAGAGGAAGAGDGGGCAAVAGGSGGAVRGRAGGDGDHALEAGAAGTAEAPRTPPQKRKKRRRKPLELRTLLLALIILVVSAMVCGAILLGHYNGDGATKKQKDSGFSDRSDAPVGTTPGTMTARTRRRPRACPPSTATAPA